MSVISEIEPIRSDAQSRAESASTLDELKTLETELLGKRSPLSALKASMASLSPDERKAAGQALNEARSEIEALLSSRREFLEGKERDKRLSQERLDLTEILSGDGSAPSLKSGSLKGRSLKRGHLHVVTQARDHLEDVFVGMGFTVSEGPEVETDWYNFEALNIPSWHPARGMFDTLYVEFGEPESTLLRTHTSPVQIRVMESTEPPIYSIMPGRVYRRDTTDASHLPNFHQIEGLVVDRGISFADLSGTIDSFTEGYFGRGIRSRLRPSYFPFTEPSAELDITCVVCEGSGCPTCGRTGWLELGGCGMVHPNVFKAVGYDPQEWSGFAFGFGIDRLAMMRHNIDDIRELVSNDVRFLEQF